MSNIFTVRVSAFLPLKMLIHLYNHGKVFRELLITILDYQSRLDEFSQKQRAEQLLFIVRLRV